MKAILIIIVAVFMFGCAEIPKVTIETSNTFLITVTVDGVVIDASCTTATKQTSGDLKCIGYFEKDGSTYKCSIAVDTAGQPVTKAINVKEHCEIDILK